MLAQAPGKSIQKFLALVLLAIMIMAATMVLPMLGQMQVAQIGRVAQQPITVPHWLDGHQVKLREGLNINGHATKHVSQQLNAWKLREMLQQGQCVASRMWCGGDKELYICVDPLTGLIGGLLVVGNEIITGYAGADGYWYDKVNGPEWADACSNQKYLTY